MLAFSAIIPVNVTSSGVFRGHVAGHGRLGVAWNYYYKIAETRITNTSFFGAFIVSKYAEPLQYVGYVAFSYTDIGTSRFLLPLIRSTCAHCNWNLS